MNAMQQEALDHARQSDSTANYAAIFQGFAAKGIEDIQPRVNVFTFHAWKALGRQVRNGEHGIKVCTWIPMTKKDDSGEAQPIGRKPKMTTVFHVSQTDPIAGFESDSAADTGQHAEVHQETKPEPEEKRQAHYTHMRPVTRQEYYSEEFTQTP